MKETYMEKQIQDIPGSFISAQEWTRLVRLCAVITNDREVAEDLAQETLLEAWRHKQKLRDPEKQAQWLSGIARNVCLRWQRKIGRELAHSAVIHAPFVGQEMVVLEETLADDYDIEVELERKELIELLDRAMALLPQETRTVLVKRYVEESPLAEVAAQLGTNTSAVAMRLQRGKLALRRVLTKEMSQDISSYRRHTIDEWEETRIWCMLCGQHRLLGKMKSDTGEFQLKCPLCCPEREDVLLRTHYPALLSGVKGYKPALSRILTWSSSLYRTSLTQPVQCIRCGYAFIAKTKLPEQAPSWLLMRSRHTIDLECPSCHLPTWGTLEDIALALPEGQKFWQRYSRIRALPEKYIEANGRNAIVTCFESVTENAQLTVISAQDNYEVLHIYGGEGK